MATPPEATAAKTQLQARTSWSAGASLIRLSGVIDESLDASQLTTASDEVVIIDLSEVHRITSSGVREWLRAFKELPRRYLGFIGCRPSLLSQFNMGVHFNCGGDLLTFYAPYLCERCDKEINELIDLRTQYAQIARMELPQVICPTCGGQAEFDDAPGHYLAYAIKAGGPHPPPEAETLLSGVGSSEATMRIAKTVHGTVTLFRLVGTLGPKVNLKRLADGLEGDVVFAMEQVTEVTPEGLERLRGVLSLEGPRFYLARLPPVVARAFSRSPQAAGRAEIVSTLVKLQCEHCRTKSQLVAGVDELQRLNHELLVSCRECKHSLVPDAEQLALAKGLPLQQLPKEIRVRLEVDAPEGSASLSPLEPFGSYQLLHRIGVGGVGEVYLAIQTGAGGFQKRVVLKRLLPLMAENSKVVQMFLREARMSARINHPNLVQVFDMGFQEGRYFMAMEYVRGLDLNQVLNRAKAHGFLMPVELAAYVVAGICAGLDAAHNFTDEDGKPQGLLHRDISPHNVLVSMDGHVKVTDFGIAKSTLGGRDDTHSHEIKGKISFIAPERFDPRLGQTDARSDVFSAGIVFYQCLTLQHPFQRPTQRQTVKALLEAHPAPIATLRPDVPQGLQQIIDLALARQPAKRYPSALAVQRDLEALIGFIQRPAGPHEMAEWLRRLDALDPRPANDPASKDAPTR